MSKPIFEGIYDPDGRRNRKSYIYFTVIYYVILGLGLTYLDPYNEVMDSLNTGSPGYGASAFLLLVGPFMLANLVVTAQRFRDFGVTGWAFLLLFVPYLAQVVKLVLCFIPGTKGENKYGPDMTQTTTKYDTPQTQEIAD